MGIMPRCHCTWEVEDRLIYYRVGQETGLFLRVDNFATVRGSKVYDM